MSKLKVQLDDAVAEKQVADEKLAALKREAKTDKQNLSAASANISQLSLQQASEQMQLDIHKQECEDLRTEIAALNDRIKELLPYRAPVSRRQDTAAGQRPERAGDWRGRRDLGSPAHRDAPQQRHRPTPRLG